MNPNGEREPAWWRVLDGVFNGINVTDVAGEALSFFGEAAAFVLSGLLEFLSGL